MDFQNHVMMISFSRRYSETVSEDLVALYDDRLVQEEDAMDYIQNYYPMYSSKVVVMTQEQYNNVLAFGKI